MSLRPTLAHIRPESPRAADWRRVFDGEAVPIRSPLPRRIEVPGPQGKPVETEAYMLDLDAVTPEQLDRLVTHIAERFGFAPEEVRGALASEGVPVLAADVSVSFDARLVL